MAKRRGDQATRAGMGGHRRWLAVSLLVGVVAAGTLWRRWQTRVWVEGPRWYGFVYRAAYLLGLKVWDRGLPAPDLVSLVEGPSPIRPGRALDIGCGTGTESIYLARHGWEVTGVDMVPRALAIARGRAAAAGVSPRFVQADATRLGDFGVGDDYSLVVDFGCFHTIPPDRRGAYVASVSGVAAPGSIFLLFGFTRPPRMAPIQAGISTEEVRERFDGNGWELIGADRASVDTIEVGGTRADDLFDLWCYRLRRLPTSDVRIPKPPSGKEDSP